MIDVLVLGAGMAGVTAARAIAHAGRTVVVLEARDRVGGRVWSVRDFAGGPPVEAGAEFVHGVGARTWPELRAAALTPVPVPTIRPAAFHLAGTTRWLPLHLAHPGTWPSFDVLWAIRRARDPDECARAFVARKGYRGRARELAEMTLAAHLPGSLDEIGVTGLVEDGVLTLEGGLNHRVAEGYDRVPQHVATGLDVRFGARIRAVAWSPDGVAVGTDDGGELHARAAITTLPFGVLRSGDVRFVPELPAAKRSAFERIAMGPVVKILLAFREPFWPRWLATLGCATGPVTLYWVAGYGAPRPAGTVAVLTAYATGPRAARLSAASEDEAVAVTLEDLARVLPGSAPRSLLVDARRIDWTTDPHARGGYTFLRPGAAGARARLAAPTTGALFWAGSATESRPIAATVEAAYVSGLRAASEALADLDRRL